MDNAGIFYGHLEYFTLLWYILWLFGNVVVIRHIFPCFGLLCQEKSGNPGQHSILVISVSSVSEHHRHRHGELTTTEQLIHVSCDLP
jgi:hypothetical protein